LRESGESLGQEVKPDYKTIRATPGAGIAPSASGKAIDAFIRELSKGER